MAAHILPSSKRGVVCPAGKTVRDRRENESFAAMARTLYGQPIARQGLTADDVPQVVCKMLERRETGGFGVEVCNIKPPAICLAAAMLAHDAV